jgi:hypothetical protein
MILLLSVTPHVSPLPQIPTLTQMRANEVKHMGNIYFAAAVRIFRSWRARRSMYADCYRQYQHGPVPECGAAGFLVCEAASAVTRSMRDSEPTPRSQLSLIMINK